MFKELVDLQPEMSSLINSRQSSSDIATTEKYSLISMSFADCEFDESKNKVFCPDYKGIDIETHRNIGLLPEDCGNIYENRIIRSNLANLYEFPWMAIIYSVGRNSEGDRIHEFKCSGTIISSRYLLSSAQCIWGMKIVEARVGDFNWKTRVDCQGLTCEDHVQDIRIEKVIIHENFTDYPQKQNDIALLRLKKPVDFSFRNAKPICLPIFERLRNLPLGGKMATLAGWIENRVELSADLQKDYVPITSKPECRELWNIIFGQFIMNDKLCAGKDGQILCMANGGSPLMVEEEYNGLYRMIQYGIMSYGPRKCSSRYPEVYTDVTKFIKWILDNIEE